MKIKILKEAQKMPEELTQKVLRFLTRLNSIDDVVSFELVSTTFDPKFDEFSLLFKAYYDFEKKELNTPLLKKIDGELAPLSREARRIVQKLAREIFGDIIHIEWTNGMFAIRNYE